MFIISDGAKPVTYRGAVDGKISAKVFTLTFESHEAAEQFLLTGSYAGLIGPVPATFLHHILPSEIDARLINPFGDGAGWVHYYPQKQFIILEQDSSHANRSINPTDDRPVVGPRPRQNTLVPPTPANESGDGPRSGPRPTRQDRRFR